MPSSSLVTSRPLETRWMEEILHHMGSQKQCNSLGFGHPLGPPLYIMPFAGLESQGLNVIFNHNNWASHACIERGR